MSVIERKLGGLIPPADAESIIFASCDTRYCADHAVKLAYSVRRNAPASHFHLHVVNPTPGLEDGLTVLSVDLGGGFTWTTEEVDLSPLSDEQVRAYYACSRFMFASFVSWGHAPLFIVDADCIVRRPLEVPKTDVGLYIRPDHPTHMRIAAGLVYVAPTRWGQDFITKVGLDLVSRFEKGVAGWYMDQIALWLTLEDMATGPMTVARFGPDVLDWEFAANSAIWTAKGPRKKSAAYLAEANAYAFETEAIRARFWGDAA